MQENFELENSGFTITPILSAMGRDKRLYVEEVFDPRARGYGTVGKIFDFVHVQVREKVVDYASGIVR